jgi:hypothetical protein
VHASTVPGLDDVAAPAGGAAAVAAEKEEEEEEEEEEEAGTVGGGGAKAAIDCKGRGDVADCAARLRKSSLRRSDSSADTSPSSSNLAIASSMRGSSWRIICCSTTRSPWEGIPAACSILGEEEWGGRRRCGSEWGKRLQQEAARTSTH